MKKIISILIIAVISIASITNVSAFGAYADSENILLNGKKIGTWKQVNFYPEVNNTLYFWARTGNKLSDGQPEQKYFQIQDGKLKEIKENDIQISNQEVDYTRIEAVKQNHFKQENHDDYTTTLYVDGKNIGTFNYDYININHLSEKAFWFKTGGLEEGKWNDYYHVYTYFDEEKIDIKSNPKVDKVLNKVFTKVDKKGTNNAQKTYKNLITKLDKLLETTKSESKKELIEYIKYKVQEKIK